MGIPGSFIGDALKDIRRAGLYRSPRVVEDVRGPFVHVDGLEVLSFCSNDYLGLAQRPELAEAAGRAAREYGWGAGASRLLSGTTPWHVELEERLARFKNAGAALFFPAGFMANLAMISSVTDSDTVILSDEYNHASMIDACRLTRARVEVYPHGSVDAVIGLLRKNRDARRRLILTDAVFSMDGDLAPLRELHGLATFHGAELVIDDAHGTGILGAKGRGTLEHFDLDGAVSLQSGGFGKAFGSSGGFIAGSFETIDLIRNRARTFLYTTAPPAALCAAGLAALDLAEHAHTERKILWRNVDHLRQGLRSIGFDAGSVESPIFPVLLGGADEALSAARKLWEAGFLVPAIRPPTVPEGKSRIRISLSALHEPEHLDALLDALRTLRP